MYDSIEWRVRNDSDFRSLVGLFENLIHSYNYSITEMKQALVYAFIKHEIYTLRPIVPWEVENWIMGGEKRDA